MLSQTQIFLTIYGPLLLAIVFLVGLAKVRRREGATAVVLNPLASFVDLKIPITGIAAVRTVLCAGVIISLASYLFLDYTALFPNSLQMEVFFDQAGVDRSLEEFDANELAGFAIPSDYRAYRERYFQQLNAEIQKLLKIDKFFSVREGAVHSSGRTTFVVEKTSGFQNYHIVESRGELNHVMEVPGRQKIDFFTFFDKLNSRDDYLRPGFSDFFVARSFVLKPLFKQMLAQDRTSQGVTFRFTVVGVTKLYFIPLPRYSNTVYLADFGSGGLVPVAYAIYR